MQGTIDAIITSIKTIIISFTLAVFFICIIIAGLMRMLSFGNERRIAASNIALTAAVVGLAIAMLSVVVSQWLGGLIQNNPIK